jgi:hypothetical protein
MPVLNYMETPLGIMVFTDTHVTNIDGQTMPENYKEEISRPDIYEALLNKLLTEGAVKEKGRLHGRLQLNGRRSSLRIRLNFQYWFDAATLRRSELAHCSLHTTRYV